MESFYQAMVADGHLLPFWRHAELIGKDTNMFKNDKIY